MVMPWSYQIGCERFKRILRRTRSPPWPVGQFGPPRGHAAEPTAVAHLIVATASKW
jgi:hypothetical protein